MIDRKVHYWDASARVVVLIARGLDEPPYEAFAYLDGAAKRWIIDGHSGTFPVTHWLPLPPHPAVSDVGVRSQDNATLKFPACSQ